MDLSIIIVNYNTKNLLKQTINSIKNIEIHYAYEIIVVDNSSSDGSPDMVRKCFPEVNLIQNDKNYGFAKANNKGIASAKGRYILLLNSDTFVTEGCIEKCIGYMDAHSDIGVLGCKVVLPDGSLDHACKRGFPTPWASLSYGLKLDKLFPKSKKFGQYDLIYLDENEINEVDSVMGAFMIVRREAIDQAGLLDEDFFMYGEDIDWCYRIKNAGWKIVYYPKAEIKHYKGSSSRKKRFKTLFEFHRAMYLFYNKHYFKKYNIIVTILVYLGIALRFIVSFLINLLKRGVGDDKAKSKIHK